MDLTVIGITVWQIFPGGSDSTKGIVAVLISDLPGFIRDEFYVASFISMVIMIAAYFTIFDSFVILTGNNAACPDQSFLCFSFLCDFCIDIPAIGDEAGLFSIFNDRITQSFGIVEVLLYASFLIVLL